MATSFTDFERFMATKSLMMVVSNYIAPSRADFPDSRQKI
tara:strand:+ start:257 stop:376 length:120 start_codon:yes stop_codon:yes gene_type:complete